MVWDEMGHRQPQPQPEPERQQVTEAVYARLTPEARWLRLRL